jgi:hypothetical protein
MLETGTTCNYKCGENGRADVFGMYVDARAALSHLHQSLCAAISQNFWYYSTLLMELETVSETLDYNSILTWLINPEDFIVRRELKTQKNY